MKTQLKLYNDITLYPGDMIQVKDKERKTYTLKYEGLVGTTVQFKQMGRNMCRTISTEFDDVANFIHQQYSKVDKVLKF